MLIDEVQTQPRTPCQPVIIIGAARSGTKLLRDCIALHPAINTIPYDINYIWRIGNESSIHDALQPQNLRDENKEKIRQEIITFVQNSSPILVEKTVSNCLRIPYIHSIFPEARYIHLIRNGCDVVESCYRQWTAKPDWRYILKKAQSYPITKAPGYAVHYAMSTLRRTFANSSSVPNSWGPRYCGIDEDLAEKDVLEVCAIQWVKSVAKAMTGFQQIQPTQILTIHYEAFVNNPLAQLEQIASFIGVDPTPYHAISFDTISAHNIGKGWRNLDESQRSIVMETIGETLQLVTTLRTSHDVQQHIEYA